MTIDLNLSSDQNQIVASMRKALAENFPVSRLRGSHATSPDRARLPLIAELGAFGLASSERIGGAGFGIVEEVLLHTELGRHLVTPKVLAASLAARMAEALGMLPLATEIAAGRTTVCLANALRAFAIDTLEHLPVHLLDPEEASLALLWNDSGMVLLSNQQLHDGRVAATDRSVVVHRCSLAEGAVVGRLAAEATPLPRQAHLLLCAHLLGIAEAVRDMAVDYATIRTQFGQPIGAFQAVKHRCANMAIGAEALGAQIALASIAERDAWPDRAFHVDACRVLAARCALENARSAIQVHGAIGFTAECDAHLYLLRAHLYENIGAPEASAATRLTRPPFWASGEEVSFPQGGTV